MLKALNLTQIIEFQSPRDPDKGTEQATTFKLGAIPTRIYANLKDRATAFTPDENVADGMKAEFKANMNAFDIVRYGLKDVTNYPVSFKTQEVTHGNTKLTIVHESFMESLDIETVRELSAEIRKLCEFDNDTIKNSEG